MQDRKLDVSVTSPHQAVRARRAAFNFHVTNCADCQPALCWEAQSQWRLLCLEALRLHAAPVKVVPLAQKDGA